MVADLRQEKAIYAKEKCGRDETGRRCAQYIFFFTNLNSSGFFRSSCAYWANNGELDSETPTRRAMFLCSWMLRCLKYEQEMIGRLTAALQSAYEGMQRVSAPRTTGLFTRAMATGNVRGILE